MRTQLRIFGMLSFILLLAASPALSGTSWYVSTTGSNTNPGTSGSPFATIQYAIGQASSGDVINIGAGTFHEAVSVSKTLTLDGAGVSSTFITPSSGNGIVVSANSVLIENLAVTGASSNGIYASGVSNLTLTNVNASSNGGSGAQLTNVATVAVNSSTFSGNTHEGFNTLGGSNYTLWNVTANGNGVSGSGVGSGVDIDGVTGTSTLTNTVANSNQRHGISIGDGSANITIAGGTFTFNGVAGNTQTGGGINMVAEAAKVCNIWVNGPVVSDSNASAGIYIYAATDSVTNVTIGSSGSITLAGNGSSTAGAGVSIIGMAKNVNITAQFNEGSIASAAGVIVVGTDNVGTNSPSGVTVSNCSFTGYTSGNPVATLSANSGTYISVNPVNAANGNSITGVTNGYQVEDLIYHKLDVATLGLVTTDANNLYVTPSSGSIQRGVDAATTGQTVNVWTGTYSESVNLNKAITLAGVDTSAFIVPPSGNGIAVNWNGVTVKTISVRNSVTDGISATGKTGLTLWGVYSTSNAGSGAQLTNCGTVSVTSGSYSNNQHEGLNAVGGSSYTISGTMANGNGTGSSGSGIDLDGITGPSTATNVSANQNHHHGISVGDGTSNLAVIGGTFTWNGVAGDATTGGGVNVISTGNTTTSNITIDGTIHSSNNTTAGIYVYCDKAGTNQINTVTIGDTGWVTLYNNGSSNITYNGGAGVLVYGKVSNAHISNCGFTKGAAPGGGLLNLGDSTLAGSPTGTTVSNSKFCNYTSAKPAVTLTDGLGDHSLNDVVATNNTFKFPVAAKVILEGPFAGPAMTTLLNTSNYIPLSQPYSAAPFNYAGTEHVAAIPANVVDWILVELRATSGGVAVSQRAVFLKNDGTVLDTTGNSTASFTETLASGYTISNFVVVRHRNHLAAMSANAVALPNESAAYDFTTAETQAFGTNSMTALSGGVFGLIAGDANSSGLVSSGDINVTINQLNSSGYFYGDTNLSGLVSSADINVIVNNLNKGTAVP